MLIKRSRRQANPARKPEVYLVNLAPDVLGLLLFVLEGLPEQSVSAILAEIG